MTKKINLKLFCIGLLIAGIIAVIASFFFKISFLVSFGIAIVAIMLNGAIAEREDNNPGGFNNPKT